MFAVILAKIVTCSLAAAVKADTRAHIQHQSEEEASCHRECWSVPKPYCGIDFLTDYQIRPHILYGHRNLRWLDRCP